MFPGFMRPSPFSAAPPPPRPQFAPPPPPPQAQQQRSWADRLAGFMGVGGDYGYDQLDPQRRRDAQSDALAMFGAALAQGGVTGQYGTAMTQGLMGARKTYRSDLEDFEKQRQVVLEQQIRERQMRVTEHEDTRAQGAFDQNVSDRGGAQRAMTDMVHSLMTSKAMTEDEGKMAASLMMGGPKNADEIYKLFDRAVQRSPEVQRQELLPKLELFRNELATRYGQPLGAANEPIKGLVTPRDEYNQQNEQLDIGRRHAAVAEQNAGDQDTELRRGQMLDKIVNTAAAMEKADQEVLGGSVLNPQRKAAEARLNGMTLDGKPFSYTDAAYQRVGGALETIEGKGQGGTGGGGHAGPPKEAGVAALRGATTLDDYKERLESIRGRYDEATLNEIKRSAPAPAPKAAAKPASAASPAAAKPAAKPAAASPASGSERPKPKGVTMGAEPAAGTKPVPASDAGARSVVATAAREGGKAKGPDNDRILQASSARAALVAWPANTRKSVDEDVAAMRARGESDKAILKFIKNAWLRRSGGGRGLGELASGLIPNQY